SRHLPRSSSARKTFHNVTTITICGATASRFPNRAMLFSRYFVRLASARNSPSGDKQTVILRGLCASRGALCANGTDPMRRRVRTQDLEAQPRRDVRTPPHLPRTSTARWLACAMVGLNVAACSSNSSNDVAMRPEAGTDAVVRDAGELTGTSATNAEAATPNVEPPNLDAGTDDGTTTTPNTSDSTDATTTNDPSDAAALPNEAEPHIVPGHIDASTGVPVETTDASTVHATSDASTAADAGADPTLDASAAPWLGFEASAALPDGAATPGNGFGNLDGGSNRQFTEVENNDDVQVANDLGYGSALVVGELYPANDWDYFRLELYHPTSSALRLHDTSDDPDLRGCEESPMGIELLRANDTVVAYGSSLDNCPAIDWRLDEAARDVPAGIYYVRVRANGTQPRVEEYRLE